jgi:hypothetical protein
LISSSLVLFALVFAVLVGGWACTYKNQASHTHPPTPSQQNKLWLWLPLDTMHYIINPCCHWKSTVSMLNAFDYPSRVFYRYYPT